MKRSFFIGLVAVWVLVFTLFAHPLSIVQGQTPTYGTYIVQSGETLYSIALKFCTTWWELQRINTMLDPNAVRPGLIIIVPLNLCGATPTPRPPDPNPNPSPNPNTGIYDRGAQKYANGTLVGNVYTVLWGDTQGGIARRFGITLAQLQQANGITQGIPIKPGNRLIIPGMGGGAGTPTPTPVIGCEIAALQLIYAYVQPNFSAQIFTPIVSGAKIRPLTRQGNWFAFSKAIYQTGSTDLLWIYTAPGLVTFAGNCNF